MDYISQKVEGRGLKYPQPMGSAGPKIWQNQSKVMMLDNDVKLLTGGPAAPGGPMGPYKKESK